MILIRVGENFSSSFVESGQGFEHLMIVKPHRGVGLAAEVSRWRRSMIMVGNPA